MPIIYCLDTAGRHNGSLETGTEEIRKGGPWKRRRVIQLLPAAFTIPAEVYLSHLVLGFPRNQPVSRFLCLGEEVGAAYSGAIDHILNTPSLSEWEYLLTLEHDN